MTLDVKICWVIDLDKASILQSEKVASSSSFYFDIKGSQNFVDTWIERKTLDELASLGRGDSIQTKSPRVVPGKRLTKTLGPNPNQRHLRRSSYKLCLRPIYFKFWLQYCMLETCIKWGSTDNSDPNKGHEGGIGGLKMVFRNLKVQSLALRDSSCV